jgi:chitinase domain-containing protein 1
MKSQGKISPGPNAPLKWMQDNVQRLDPEAKFRSKILLGLNVYGYSYQKGSRDAILGSSFLDFIKSKSPKIQWQDTSFEHYFISSTEQQRQVVFYPTLHSINERLALAESLGTGISIWEIGQGLDCFYELL